jgi:hypothetical protein
MRGDYTDVATPSREDRNRSWHKGALGETSSCLERPVRTTGRDLLIDLASEYANRARAKAALAPTSWHNATLALSEAIIVKHAAELCARRRQLAATSNDEPEGRWLQEVENFIDEALERSGGQVRNSPELLRAVRWMIGSATSQWASSDTQSAAVADAA